MSEIQLKTEKTRCQQLSDSLLAACKAAGIEKPRYVAQDKDDNIYHYKYKPESSRIGSVWWGNDFDCIRVYHPPYAPDWHESLLEWVEPQGEPLADVLARHGESESDDACKIAYRAFMSEDHRTITGFPRAADIYERAWQDAMKCKGGSEQPSGIEALVCEDIAKRQRTGMNKYGTTVADNPLELRQWLNHAYEECLDMAIYLKRSMAENEKGGSK